MVPETVQEFAEKVLLTPGPVRTQEVCTFCIEERVKFTGVETLALMRSGEAVIVPVGEPEQAPPTVRLFAKEPPGPLQESE